MHRLSGSLFARGVETPVFPGIPAWVRGQVAQRRRGVRVELAHEDEDDRTVVGVDMDVERCFELAHGKLST